VLVGRVVAVGKDVAVGAGVAVGADVQAASNMNIIGIGIKARFIVPVLLWSRLRHSPCV
jgi:predicted thioesterase